MPYDSIVVPKNASIKVFLGPVQDFQTSLVLLYSIDKLPGMNPSIMEINRSMTTEERLNNRIIVHGLHYCFFSVEYWSGVPEFISHLNGLQPEVFKERLFQRYADKILIRKYDGNPGLEKPETIDLEKILKTEGSFLEFIRDNFEIRHADFETEALSYQYLVDPPKLKSFIISHLKTMWEKYLSREWERNKPLLEESVSAFQKLDLTSMDRFEAVKTVTNQDVLEEWQEWPWKVEWLRQACCVLLTPSPFIGPYVVKYIADNTFHISYGARLPEGIQAVTSDLNRNDLNVRLNALADDTRLKMIQLIAEQGELSSQEIMNQLELSQSATSRHLKQLSATGFLKERRQTSAKVYEINEEFAEKTIGALAGFLQKRH